ncbi:Aste57867_19803 [Aphanomyces stellatus]|uniref:Aste57867_19803 protein n=1 Tax=Aphanomyces stellatus TaxID=120398 RepID=A0A485LI23_9STRA|nr:hypothetical protein As57867_019738 [Aphanomyces stellatus]VFT96501.1 Aste57867_19803 [Aphanomyces stellatus]
MTSLVISILLVQLLVHIVGAQNTLVSTCPPKATTTQARDDGSPSNTTFACLRAGNTTVAIVQVNAAVLNLSGQNIVAVEGLPTTPQIIDLSKNAIRSMNVVHATVLSLNLRDNALTTDGLVNLPSDINYLDLSNNAIDRIDLTTFNWTRLPKLTSLNLSGNALKSFRMAKFPPTLTSLDLSGNRFETFEVDAATFAQLNDPSFRLVYPLGFQNIAFIREKCNQISAAYVSNFMCIAPYDTSRAFKNTDEPDNSLTQIATNISACVMGIGLAVWGVNKYWKRERMAYEATIRPREHTIVSSNCDDFEDAPMQYRASVTPIRAA